jgi:hypothetical protein
MTIDLQTELRATRGITDTQSYSQVIRDTFFATVVQLPFFAGYIARRSKQLPIQQPLLPYLGVYIIDELMPPDGDLNAGDIRFIHTLRIGFQVIIESNDPVAAELELDAAFWAIMNGLWSNTGLTNMITTTLPDNTRFEGVERGTRRHVWGVIGRGETPIGELEYIASIRLRTEWYPSGFPDLLEINVQTVPLADDGTVPPAAQVQRIISDYEFTPSRLAGSTRETPAQGDSDGRPDIRSNRGAQEGDRDAQGDAGEPDAEAGARPHHPGK